MSKSRDSGTTRVAVMLGAILTLVLLPAAASLALTDEQAESQEVTATFAVTGMT